MHEPTQLLCPLSPITTQKRLQTTSLLPSLQRPSHQESSSQKQASPNHLRNSRCVQKVHDRAGRGSRITQKSEQLRYEDVAPLSQPQNGELLHPGDRTTKQTA